jgi:transcriptional regulator EpsA
MGGGEALNDNTYTNSYTGDAVTVAAKPPGKAFELTAPEAERFLRIIAESLQIKSHYELFAWLNGDLRVFLPHQILISAWGDFARWDLKLDVISALPGVRTAQIAGCRVDDVMRACYARWIGTGRKPLVLRSAEILGPRQACPCRVHAAFRNMRSVLVHGLRDERSGHESLYIALDSADFKNGCGTDRFISLVRLVICQLDVAIRKVAAFPLTVSTRPASRAANGFELSAREQEILDWIRLGKTNLDIAVGLAISPFTVKNHVQRIFRKIGVCNRTQAAAKYHQALQESSAGSAS